MRGQERRDGLVCTTELAQMNEAEDAGLREALRDGMRGLSELLLSLFALDLHLLLLLDSVLEKGGLGQGQVLRMLRRRNRVAPDSRYSLMETLRILRSVSSTAHACHCVDGNRDSFEKRWQECIVHSDRSFLEPLATAVRPSTTDAYGSRFDDRPDRRLDMGTPRTVFGSAFETSMADLELAESVTGVPLYALSGLDICGVYD